MDQISQELSEAANEQRSKQDKLLAGVRRFVDSKYAGMDEGEGNLYRLKKMIRMDLREYILTGGSKGRTYIHHFAHEYMNPEKSRCTLCFMWCKNRKAKNNHVKRHHKVLKVDKAVSTMMMPESRLNKRMCLVCSKEMRGINNLSHHIEEEHTLEERKKFGLVTLSHIQQHILCRMQ